MTAETDSRQHREAVRRFDEPTSEPDPVPTTSELADLLRKTVEALKAEQRLADAMTLSTGSCERALEGLEPALAEARELLEDLGEPVGEYTGLACGDLR